MDALKRLDLVLDLVDAEGACAIASNLPDLTYRNIGTP
jgi:hypothetical protein